MKISLVSMRIKSGQCEENYEIISKAIQKAIAQKVDLIVFPQNAVSGYLLGDRWLDANFCQYVDHFNDAILEYSDQIAIVWGNVRYRRGKCFNAAFFAYKKQTHMRLKPNQKSTLQNDFCYFQDLKMDSTIEFQGKCIALNFGHAKQIADLNINLDAQPYTGEANAPYVNQCIYVNAFGMQNVDKNVVLMQGGSYVYMNQQLYYQAPYAQANETIIDLDLPAQGVPQSTQLLDVLIQAIKCFDEEIFPFKNPWIIGLSGGIDSAITCALLCMALGKKRIHAFHLTSKYNSSQSIKNAKSIAKALAIPLKSENMEAILKHLEAYIDDNFVNDAHNETLYAENIQSRLRGFLLNAFASKLNGVIVNNANKIEIALGYCTLYGDSIGALSLIGDLTKREIFELARAINAHANKIIIPLSLIPKINNGELHWDLPPSAELKKDQKDPMKWFYHDAMLESFYKHHGMHVFMQHFLNQDFSADIQFWLEYYHLTDSQAFLKDIEWVLNTIQKNIFKRLQSPPIVLLHKQDWGTKGIVQSSIGHKEYTRLKQAIVDKK